MPGSSSANGGAIGSHRMMKILISLIKKYLLLSGLAVNVFVIAVYLIMPHWFEKGQTLAVDKLSKVVPGLDEAFAEPAAQYTLADELAANFSPWQPLPETNVELLGEVIDSSLYASLQDAANLLKEGNTLQIAPGIYKEALVIKADHVTVVGRGHVVLDGTAAEGKAAIVNKGSFNVIRNIECRNITVGHNNGSCVRHEGENLKLDHVYFHDSQQGILTGYKAGTVEITDSRFENLGQGGQAHGMYVNGSELILRDSLVLAAKSQGHEVKSRAARTLIENSVIASLSGKDSRLVDVPNGGVLEVRNSILQQGPRSANQDAIGYGLEGIKHEHNSITLSENLFILEREGVNYLLHKPKDRDIPLTASNNLVISEKQPSLPGLNFFFETREEAGVKAYPVLPELRATD